MTMFSLRRFGVGTVPTLYGLAWAPCQLCTAADLSSSIKPPELDDVFEAAEKGWEQHKENKKLGFCSRKSNRKRSVEVFAEELAKNWNARLDNRTPSFKAEYHKAFLNAGTATLIDMSPGSSNDNLDKVVKQLRGPIRGQVQNLKSIKFYQPELHSGPDSRVQEFSPNPSAAVEKLFEPGSHVESKHLEISKWNDGFRLHVDWSLGAGRRASTTISIRMKEAAAPQVTLDSLVYKQFEYEPRKLGF